MMISPYEEEAAIISNEDLADMRLNKTPEEVSEVSRLEFYSVDRPALYLSTEEKVSAQDDLSIRHEREMEVLRVQLRSQMLESPARIEVMREETRAEVRQEWQIELEKKITEERELILEACEQFRRERERYFASVESEVVKLALAIAARVLHREAKLDPLMLAAAVRIALEKIENDSSTLLRVPEVEVEQWRAIIASAQFAEMKVQVVTDKKMNVGECALDTKVGRVELGVSAQLSEIETGFFDLLQKRPA